MQGKVTIPHLNPLPLRGEEIFGILFILLIPLSCLLKIFSAISASSAVEIPPAPFKKGEFKN